MKPLVIIAGPTAVGKSAVAVSLSKKISGEVISADSIQIYKHMDIGSAKITPEQMEGVPHHLISELEPDEEFNVYIFQKMAKELVGQIHSRGRVPVIAGGTAFYIQSVLYDIDLTDEEGDPAYRERLYATAREKGNEHVHDMLREVDPDSAEKIHPNNLKRVIRALEFYRQTGSTISEHNSAQKEKKSPYDFAYFVLTDKRDEIYARIDKRVDEMFENGLAGEVRALMEAGYDRSLVSMQGIGYKEVVAFLSGEESLEETKRVIKQESRHYAKRQLTWLRHERNACFIDISEFERDAELVAEHIFKILTGRGIVS